MAFVHFPHTATLWAVSGVGEYGGRTFAAPASITVNWQDSTEKFIGANGEERVSRAKVFVQQDIDVGSYLYLGTSSGVDPYDVSNAFEVKSFSKVQGIGGEYERKAML